MLSGGKGGEGREGVPRPVCGEGEGEGCPCPGGGRGTLSCLGYLLPFPRRHVKTVHSQRTTYAGGNYGPCKFTGRVLIKIGIVTFYFQYFGENWIT